MPTDDRQKTIRILPAPDDGEGRVETGAVQFGDEWAGLFVRGDDCAALFSAWEVVRMHLPDVPRHWDICLQPLRSVMEMIRDDVDCGDSLQGLEAGMDAVRLPSDRWPLTEQDVLEELLASVEHPNADAERIALARLMLLRLMRSISEEAYCAGWLSGLTGALHRCVEEQSTDFGMGFSADLLDLLTATQAIAGGWWVQDLDAGIREPVFVEKWTPDEEDQS